ncbi:Subunit beta [Oopsacas minuta]|uniref:Coatomer subunit beta n=1 Tax=Oopsacas minuta TaxID=111878 RepID=A0AAV7K0G3_9METZ|nr:Subunit beta [Oopsacas minuta]
MAITSEQSCFTLISKIDDSESVNDQVLKQDLENGNDNAKIATMKRIIHLMLNGEKLTSLLMTVIRFVLPTHNHTLKKLLFIYFEIIPKTTAEGKLRHEMILVCDAYRKDLQHANEFVRGSTLRFLCKLREAELLEPLMPSIRSCLEYKHPYVRRNAVLAVFTIYQHCSSLIPDAPDLVLHFLEQEGDPSCKRNAFLMLLHVDERKALDYLAACQEQVAMFGDIMQLVVVELIYKVCHKNSSERGRFLRSVYSLLGSSSSAVRYEAAGTLVTLSNTPTAIKAVAQCYIELVVSESDNNVKIIVLDRLKGLCNKPSHRRVLQGMVMDLLSALEAPDIEVRRKTLDLVLYLVNLKTAPEVSAFLRRELTQTSDQSQEDENIKYKRHLILCLHTCCSMFPEIASSILPSMMDSVLDQNDLIACDVLKLVREMTHLYPTLREDLIRRLTEIFSQVENGEVLRQLLWVLGQHCMTEEEITRVMQEIRLLVGELPIVESEQRKEAAGEDDSLNIIESVPTGSHSYVTADGTYATQSALSSATSQAKKLDDAPTLRKKLLEGNYTLACSLAGALSKLAITYASLCNNQQSCNALKGEAMLIISSMLRLGRSKLLKKPVPAIELDHLWLCLRLLSSPDPSIGLAVLDKTRKAVDELLSEQSKERKMKDTGIPEESETHADDAILFGLLVTGDALDAENRFEASLLQAVGSSDQKDTNSSSESKLDRVYQMTGFSDPIYAEAYVYVHQYDIILDILIVNQTPDTLQGVLLELATHGDLKLVEKPSQINLAPQDFANIKAAVKVSSTENGVIFGNIVYDVAGTASSDKNCVVLNDIHIDIMDYIRPGHLMQEDFRKKWTEFEWENKLSVNTSIKNMQTYLEHIVKSTNMKCLTPPKALSGECDFLSANLYARSIFGEEALANISLKKPQDKDVSVTGHVRIRAKSQGMALSLGDKINISQKKDISV